VGKVLAQSVLDVARIVAGNVLPCQASFAKDSLSVIVREATDTLDSVMFFVFRRLLLFQLRRFECDD
jgi:hypothetical protein